MDNLIRREYPAWLKKPYSQNAHGLAETLGRIGSRVDGWTALEREKEAALAWCRANGNPHIPETPPLHQKEQT